MNKKNIAIISGIVGVLILGGVVIGGISLAGYYLDKASSERSNNDDNMTMTDNIPDGWESSSLKNLTVYSPESWGDESDTDNIDLVKNNSDDSEKIAEIQILSKAIADDESSKELYGYAKNQECSYFNSEDLGDFTLSETNKATLAGMKGCQFELTGMTDGYDIKVYFYALAEEKTSSLVDITLYFDSTLGQDSDYQEGKQIISTLSVD